MSPKGCQHTTPHLVGACLAPGDRIFATGSGTVSKCVFAIVCLLLLDFRAYNHGLKVSQKPKLYCDNELFAILSFTSVFLLLGREPHGDRILPVSRRIPRQHVPTTTPQSENMTYVYNCRKLSGVYQPSQGNIEQVCELCRVRPRLRYFFSEKKHPNSGEKWVY